MYSKSPFPTPAKGSRGSCCCAAMGPVSAAIQIHGLILSCKGRKTFAWCALQAETGFYFFLFLALQRLSQQPEVPWLHPWCPGDAVGPSPVLGDSAPGHGDWGPSLKLHWLVWGCIKSSLVAFGSFLYPSHHLRDSRWLSGVVCCSERMGKGAFEIYCK